MIRRVAVPPTNCAVPTIAVSSQNGADASQKLTVPAATGAPFAVTEAVKVTAVCHATEDEEIVSVVVVGNGAACAAVVTLQATVSNSLKITRWNATIRL